VRKSRSRGSVRGALGNGRPYRDNAAAGVSKEGRSPTVGVPGMGTGLEVKVLRGAR
jgi:hypothetical protein